MAPTAIRSTMEEMLDSIKKTDEKHRDVLPALPQRPTSRARLPSSVRARKIGSSVVDGKTRISGESTRKITPRLCKPVVSPISANDSLTKDDESPAKIAESPTKSRDFPSDNSNGATVNMPASPLTPKPAPVIADVSRKENEEREVHSNGNVKGRSDHKGSPGLNGKSSRATTKLAENGSTTQELVPVASGGSMSRRWRDETTALSLKKNSRVWCLTPEKNWALGMIQSAKDSESVVRTLDGQLLRASTPTILPANPDILEGVDDLVKLSYLNEPAVLHNLQYRYLEDNIYTRAGPVLIAINPFKKIPIYTSEFVQAYRKKAPGEILGPHVYMTADCAYGAMVKDGVNQSIIISGESGAGKTETAKIAMQYLADLGGGSGVEDEILQTNPILEAFGNAKTLRNDNSSRFGKLIDIHFDKLGRICGAKIQTYLLEKSRVVQQSQGERSYHIFYQLCAGAGPALRDRLKLRPAQEYNYLNQSNCLVICNVDDSDEFQAMKKAMHVVQIVKEDQERAFEMLAAVLWLGNITFTVIDTENHVAIDDKYALETAALLLHCKVERLSAALLTRNIHAGNEDIVQNLTHSQAVDSRDALAKAIYAQLFDWLVDRINKSLEVGKRRTGRSISILDIYGFESFKENSFEQLCINYANERLQQHFNRHLFKLEQEEYTLEGIDWTRVDFEDNQECLDLIEKKPLGLISLLDEECTFPKASNITLANKLKEHLKGNACFKGERSKAFRIGHYAGEVVYDTSGFLEKNRDLLHADLLQLLASCCSPLPQLFANIIGESAQRMFSPTRRGSSMESQKQSVATKFKGQLLKLMQRLESTEPHFIRCIKPNSLQFPGIYEQELVLQQLRCCGVLEVVRISRSGYPTRYFHHKFADRYGFLLPNKLALQQEALSVCLAILHQFGIPPEMYQVGITKLFFRAGQIGILEDMRLQTLQGVICMQKLFRGFRVRRQFMQLRKSTIFLQSMARGVKARRNYKILRQQNRAAIMIQKHVRGRTAVLNFILVRRSTLTLQTAGRRFLAMRKLQLLRNEHEAKLKAAAEVAAREAAAVAAREATIKEELAGREAAAAASLVRVSVDDDTPSDGSLPESPTSNLPPSLQDSHAEGGKGSKGEIAIRVQPTILLELQRRVLAAEKALREKEDDNTLLRNRLQQYEARWLEHQAKMESMEEMWQRQMTSLQVSLAAAKKSLANDEAAPMIQTRQEDSLNLRISVSRHRATRHILPQEEDDFDWDDSTTMGTKSPDMSMTPRKYPPYPSLEYNPMSRGELDAGRSLVNHLVTEFDQRTQVFNDDADFLVEVKSGQTEAPLNPENELKKLKQRFDIWRKDYKVRLRETKALLHRLGHMEPAEKGKKKWWGKRVNM